MWYRGRVMASKLTPKPKFRSLCSLGNIPKIFMLGPTREPNLIGLGGGPVRDTFYKHLGVSTIGRLKTSIYNTISVSPSLHSSTPTPDQLLVSSGAGFWIQICVGPELVSITAITLTITSTISTPTPLYTEDRRLTWHSQRHGTTKFLQSAYLIKDAAFKEYFYDFLNHLKLSSSTSSSAFKGLASRKYSKHNGKTPSLPMSL